MKTIFHEHKKVGVVTEKFFHPARDYHPFYDEWSTTHVAKSVSTANFDVSVTFTAYWDKATGVLYCDHFISVDEGCADEWIPPLGKYMAVVGQKSDALRRAVSEADLIYGLVTDTIPKPDVRDDEQVEADYLDHERQEAVEQEVTEY